MKTRVLMCVLLGAGLAGNCEWVANAGSESQPSTDARAAITQAVKAAYPDAKIKGMTAETEDGNSFYEVKFTSHGTKFEADVMTDGTILETDEAAELSAFPEPAAAAIKSAGKDARIHDTEIVRKLAKVELVAGSVKITKLNEPAVSYEADLKKAGMSSEIAVDAKGLVLESPKWVKSKDNEEKD